MRRLALVLILVSIAGCASFSAATRGITEPPKMTTVVLEHVPIGTPVGDAKAFMEREGFQCELVTNGPFRDRAGLDYIYCDRMDGGPWGITAQRWQLALVHRDGKVTEILANTGLIGP